MLDKSRTTIPLEWSAFLNALAPLKTVVERATGLDDDPLLRQEAVQQLAMTVAQAYMAIFCQDPHRPHLVTFTNPLFNSGTNPDYMYFYAAIDGKGTYQLSGSRGTSLFIHVQQNPGMIGLDDVPGTTLSTIEIDTLKIDAKGNFTLLMSAEKPAGFTGNWWKLDPRCTSISIRQASYDWAGEHDGRFAIECLDKHPPGPRLSAEEIAGRLLDMGKFADRYLNVMLSLVKTMQEIPMNTLKIISWGQFSGIANQYYYQGRYEIEPDEALIIETDIPDKVRYWGIVTLDMLFDTLEWVNNQGSLNGFQAKRDKDGKFRAVLSLQDPGVPNWLDPVGRTRGILQGRWFESSSGPTPTIKRVKASEVRKHLPADTPVMTADQRDEALRVRRRGAQFRRKW